MAETAPPLTRKQLVNEKLLNLKTLLCSVNHVVPLVTDETLNKLRLPLSDEDYVPFCWAVHAILVPQYEAIKEHVKKLQAWEVAGHQPDVKVGDLLSLPSVVLSTLDSGQQSYYLRGTLPAPLALKLLRYCTLFVELLAPLNGE